MKRAYVSFDLRYGQIINEEQFTQVKKKYRTSALKHHPDKITKEKDERDEAFKVRKDLAEKTLKELSSNYELIDAEYALFVGK